MTTSLRDNAYHVLGLTGTATDKKILQRSNEIVQRLKIDDVAEYDLDMPIFKNYRTEGAVRDALRRLQTPKARLKEYFFWFRIADDIDKNAANYLAQRDFGNAIAVWRAASGEESNGALTHKRNLALALTISLLHGADPGSQTKAALSEWAALLDSHKFWYAFAGEYKQDAALLSEEAISDFRRNSASDLSDVFVEIQDVLGQGDFVYQFQQVFSSRGKKVEEKIFNPVSHAIQKAIEELEQIKLGETDDYSAKASQIKLPVAAMQAELNKLIDAGLYEDSTTKLLRDHAATALRSVGIDIHNNHDDFDTSLKLLQFAMKIAGTDSLKTLLTTDLEKIQEHISCVQDNTLAIEVPGAFGGGTIVFTPGHVTYGRRKIHYKDATRMSFHAVRSSVNLIPTSQSYSFMVGSEEQTIDISWGTTLYIGNAKKQDVWQRLAGIASHVIQPIIVEKLVRRIFADGKAVQIGELEFTREGYSRRKFFGGREDVSWSDTIYVPQFGAGSVTVWKNKNGKGVSFATISMSTPNAVVLPDLVEACVNVVTNARR